MKQQKILLIAYHIFTLTLLRFTIKIRKKFHEVGAMELKEHRTVFLLLARLYNRRNKPAGNNTHKKQMPRNKLKQGINQACVTVTEKLY